MKRWMIYAAIGITGLGLIAGCGKSQNPQGTLGDAAPTTAPATDSPAAVATPTGAATSPTTPAAPATTTSTASGGGGSVPTCNGANVSMTDADGGSASTHVLVIFTITNEGDTCQTTGYPTVQFRSVQGLEIQAKGFEKTMTGFMGGVSGATPPVVTLLPGEKATFMVEAENFDSATGDSCTPPYYARVSLPNDSVGGFTQVRWVGSGCADWDEHPIEHA